MSNQDDFYLVRFRSAADPIGFDDQSNCYTEYADVVDAVDGCFSGNYVVHSILHIYGSISDDITREFKPAPDADERACNRADAWLEKRRDEAFA